MCTTASLLVCFYSLGVCRVYADPDFLNVDLTGEVNTTSTDGDLRKESVSISWLDRPPYIYDEKGPRTGKLLTKATDSSEDQVKGKHLKSKENIKGIFYEIITKGLQLCGVYSQVNFTTKAQDLQQLDQSIVKKKADLAMPVHGGDDNRYGGYYYVEILKSPGVVFIVNKDETKEHLRKQVAQAMKDTWPVVVITLLLTGFAGLIIWGLDTSRNPEQFPRSFTRGVMEGIWWSFVSMTTVGYGDRVPKSLFARFFGILWILTGLVLCSFFTATFTSALTASSIKQQESLLGVKVAVITDSHAFEEATNHAANVKDYPDFYQMYHALVESKEVEGILADIYTASYCMAKINDPRLAVSMILSSQRSIGFVIGHNEEKEELNEKGGCLRKLFKYRQRDIKKIILQHTHTFHTQTQNRTDHDNDDILTLLDGNSGWFRKTSLALLISYVVMLVIGFTYEICFPKCRAHRLRRPNGCGINSFKMEASLPSCKPNR